MELKKMSIEKVLRTSGVKKDGSGVWERTDIVMRDLHSQVETRFVARVQKRVLETGIVLKEGDEWDVGLSLGCREFEGRYYNELSIWQMTPAML